MKCFKNQQKDFKITQVYTDSLVTINNMFSSKHSRTLFFIYKNIQISQSYFLAAFVTS